MTQIGRAWEVGGGGDTDRWGVGGRGGGVTQIGGV